MLIDIFNNSVSSFIRMFIYLLIFVYVRTEFLKVDIPCKKILQAVPTILLVRELVLAIYSNPSILFISDIIVQLILIYFVISYIPELKSLVQIASATLVVVLFLITSVYTAMQFVELPINISENLLIQLANIVLIASIVLYAAIMFRITPFNSQQSEFIINTRSVVAIAIAILSRILFIIFPSTLSTGIDSQLAQRLISVNISVSSFALFIHLVYNYSKYDFVNRIAYDQFTEDYIQSVFGFLNNIARSMIDRVKAKEVLEYAIQTTVKLTSADSGVIFLKNEKDELVLTATTGYFPPPYALPQATSSIGTGIRDFSRSTSHQTILARREDIQTFFENTPIKMGDTIFGEVAQNNQNVFIRFCSEDERMKVNSQEDIQYINSLMVFPMDIDNKVAGVFALAHRERDRYFTQDIFERTKIFVQLVSLNLESLNAYIQLLDKQEIERDISIAAEIQQKLLPSRLPAHISNTIAAWSQPLKGVSGDYYDIIPLNEKGKIAIIICDVAGKGVPASLIMVMIRTITHLIATSGSDTASIMRTINKSISERQDVERFATMSYLTFDPETGVLEYSNAAHHPVLIYKNINKTIEAPMLGDLPIGLEATTNYEVIDINLERGDAIMLYTDGIIEALSPEGEQYEEDRLKLCFMANAHKSAHEVLQALKDNINSFVNNAVQHDDQTLIIMKYK